MLLLASLWIALWVGVRDRGAPDDVYLPPITIAAIALVFGCMSLRRELARRSVTVEGEKLVVRQPGVLPKRLVIAFSDVALVAFDDRPYKIEERNGRFPILRRDPFVEARAWTPGWLLSPEHGCPLPTLTHERQIPNMAIVLRRRIKVAAIRRTTLLRGKLLRFPSPRKPSGGFVVQIDDVSAARRILAEGGVRVGTITDADIRPVLPTTKEFAREHRRRTVATAAVVALAFARAAIPVGGTPTQASGAFFDEEACGRVEAFFMSSPSPEWPKHSPRRVAAKMRRNVKTSNLKGSFLRPDGRGFRLHSQRPVSGSDLAAERVAGEPWEKRLRRLGFVDGWSKTWESDEGLRVDVLRFSSEAGAYADQMMDHAVVCPWIIDSYPVEGLDWGVGIRVRGTSYFEERLSFVKNDRRFVIVLSGGRPNDRGFLKRYASELAEHN